MNKRIRELSRIASEQADASGLASPLWNVVFEKKFAELIVRDCLNEIKGMVVDESELLYPNNKQTTECVNDRLMDAHDNIVEYFGIEL